MQLSEEQIERYRAGWRQKAAEYTQRQLQRQHLGWQIARQGAQVLKDQFQVQRVWLFGSLLETHRIHEDSDIDLAVEGLDMEQYLEAVGSLSDLSPQFLVDLVPIERAPQRLHQTIREQGVEL